MGLSENDLTADDRRTPSGALLRAGAARTIGTAVGLVPRPARFEGRGDGRRGAGVTGGE